MTLARTGIAAVCDARNRVTEWVCDDLNLSHHAPPGSDWQNILHPDSRDTANAFITTARSRGAALDWPMQAIIDDQPQSMRFAAAAANHTFILLGHLAQDPPPPNPASRRTTNDQYNELTRLNNELVNTQRTLMQQNAQLTRANEKLEQMHRQLEHSQAELLEANRRLIAQTHLDGLTGIHNRRALQTRLNEEIDRADRYGSPLTLAMVDVDHFKAFNDTLGHLAGDDALRTVATQLQAAVRNSDFVARYGGEEFAIILPGIVGQAAEDAAQRIRLAVADADWPEKPITISIGLACHGPLIANAEDLIQHADQALYAAKQAGRNRIHTAWQTHKHP